MRRGLTFIDTAQAHGSGESEIICGELFKGMARDSFVIQKKWYDVPDNLKDFTHSAPAKYLKASLDRMGLDHGRRLPGTRTYLRPIRGGRAKGLKEHVDNCKPAKKHGIVFQSYSSLGQGRLTGKYTPEHDPPKMHLFSQCPMQDPIRTVELLATIGIQRGVPPAALALN